MKSAAPILVTLFVSPFAGTAAPAPIPPACTSSETRQFDFWVGKWDVYATSKPDQKVATSLIEKLYHGCAIRENWMPLNDNPGGSMNAYSPEQKQWRQFWADSAGGSAQFSGGWNGISMILTGTWPQPGHPTQMTRMTYTPLSDGQVEQVGVTSDDAGKTWQPSFDFIYKPAS
jgi:hypothetical protein